MARSSAGGANPPSNPVKVLRLPSCPLISRTKVDIPMTMYAKALAARTRHLPHRRPAALLITLTSAVIGAPGGCAGETREESDSTGGQGAVAGASASASGSPLAQGGEVVEADAGSGGQLGTGGNGPPPEVPIGDYFNPACPAYHQLSALDECRACVVGACGSEYQGMFEDHVACPSIVACVARCSCGVATCYTSCRDSATDGPVCDAAIAELRNCGDGICEKECSGGGLSNDSTGGDA
jgi:hypothetical protein